MPDTPKPTASPSIVPCGNDDCDKCDPRPRWKISQHRIQHLTHERKIKAASEEEALRIYDVGTAWPSTYDDRGGMVVQRDPVQIERLPPDAYNLTECCWHDLRDLPLIAADTKDTVTDGHAVAKLKSEVTPPETYIASRASLPERSATPAGTYIASHTALPERSAAWRRLRDIEGWKISSSWIDETSAGEITALGARWVRIETEVARSERLILHIESENFPLKEALIEVGMAIAHQIPIRVVAPCIMLDPTSSRHLGSWIRHPLVTPCDTIEEALEGATVNM